MHTFCDAFVDETGQRFVYVLMAVIQLIGQVRRGAAPVLKCLCNLMFYAAKTVCLVHIQTYNPIVLRLTLRGTGPNH